MYTFYSVLVLAVFVLASPWFVYQALRYRKYVGGLGQRMGYLPVSFNMDGDESIWIHAVSVGETRAAEPMVNALAQAHPEASFVLTHMTPGGRNAARQVFGTLIDGGRLASVYLPYDLGPLVRRFLRRFRPSFGLLWETEVWPNVVAQCQAADVPLALVNARLSERSARRGARMGALMRDAAAGLALAVAQTQADAQRLRVFGVAQVEVAGNMKFDVAPDAALLAMGRGWREAIGTRSVVVLASTRESDGRSEEGALLGAFMQARLAHPVLARALIVVVPRHPQRFDAVTEIARAFGLRTVRRSAGLPDAQCEVWIGDSMGELPAYYALADLAFIGGSLLPLGGQNLIEACACGCGVLIGPHTHNFAQASDDAIAAGAARRVDDAASLWTEVHALLAADAVRAAMAQAALDFAQAHRGATARTVEALSALRARLGSAPHR